MDRLVRYLFNSILNKGRMCDWNGSGTEGNYDLYHKYYGIKERVFEMFYLIFMCADSIIGKNQVQNIS